MAILPNSISSLDGYNMWDSSTKDEVLINQYQSYQMMILDLSKSKEENDRYNKRILVEKIVSLALNNHRINFDQYTALIKLTNSEDIESIELAATILETINNQ
jgi:hypothetical protein